MTYSEKLKNPKWQKKRLRILERDNWSCQLCNDKETELHVHHKKYTGQPWDAADEDLTTNCKHCHAIITLAEKAAPGLIVVSAKKYSEDFREKILMVLLTKNPSNNYSVFFITIHKIDAVIDQVINMAPQVIRDLTKEMDVIKQELTKDNG